MSLKDLFGKVKGIITHVNINDIDVDKVVKYLQFYGYIKNQAADGLTATEIIDAIKRFQNMFGMTQDGNISLNLLKAISLPRCGFPDVYELSDAQKERLNKWNKNGIKYYVDKYVSTLPPDTQLGIIQKAFDSWTKVANISATRTTNSAIADIIISTGNGARDQFDGPSGTLAWCYLPDGQDSQLMMKYDASENWVDSPMKNGIDMGTVSAHEFGHGLGLTHSAAQGALMAPFYNASVNVPQQRDDIPRIQSLYGPAVSAPTPTPVPTPTPSPTPTPNGNDVIITLPPGTLIKNITGYRLTKLAN